MNLNDYQQNAMATCLPSSKNLIYMTLGLGNEAGEFQGKLKKQIRDGVFDKEAAAKELGDVLWYVAGCATLIDFTLEDIAEMNLAKLNSRAKRGVIGGNGDER